MSEEKREKLYDEEIEETTMVKSVKSPEEAPAASEAAEEASKETAVETSAETASEAEDTSKKEAEEKKKKIKVIYNKVKDIMGWVATIVAAFLCAIIINIYFFRISQVNGSSMNNTYSNGDIVVVTRIPYLFGGEAKRGDVIIFDALQIEPGERTFWDDYSDTLKYNIFTRSLNKNISFEHKYYIKRVIGLPGDTIEIKEDGLYINGELYEEDYIKSQNWESKYVGQTWTISDDCYFVMGDNRNNSKDSRIIGEISKDCVMGKVITKGKNEK